MSKHSSPAQGAATEPRTVTVAYRGDGTDRPELPVPPAPMALIRAGRLRKRWRYLSAWSPELSLCAARVEVGPFRQEFWAVWDRAAGRLWERTRLRSSRVQLSPGRLLVRDRDVGGDAVQIDVALAEDGGYEVLCADGEAYTWTRKQMVAAIGTVRLGGAARPLEAVALIDDNAGYHPRRTRWNWSAGAGVDTSGRAVAWNLIAGLNDPPEHSERTVWVDGDAAEVGPVTFSPDRRQIRSADDARLSFEPEIARGRRDNLAVVRSTYGYAFGTYRGALPGGVELAEAHGVVDHHDAVW